MESHGLPWRAATRGRISLSPPMAIGGGHLARPLQSDTDAAQFGSELGEPGGLRVEIRTVSAVLAAGVKLEAGDEPPAGDPLCGNGEQESCGGLGDACLHTDPRRPLGAVLRPHKRIQTWNSVVQIHRNPVLLAWVDTASRTVSKWVVGTSEGGHVVGTVLPSRSCSGLDRRHQEFRCRSSGSARITPPTDEPRRLGPQTLNEFASGEHAPQEAVEPHLPGKTHAAVHLDGALRYHDGGVERVPGRTDGVRRF